MPPLGLLAFTLAVVPGPARAADPPGTAFLVTCADDSVFRVRVLDEVVEYDTRFGRLKVPVRAIDRLEVAHRPSDAGKQKTAADREFDLLVTADSQIAGRVLASSFRVVTAQFGEQRLRLADVRSLRSLTAAAPTGPEVAAGDGPINMTGLEGQFGRTFVFRVTGAAAGSVWGTGTYTLDSTLAAAAVHAGVLRPGQTGAVRVRVVPSPPSFTGSVRNGVSSVSYGPYARGAYEIVTGR